MSHVSPLLKSTVTFRSEGRLSAIFERPNWLALDGTIRTTTAVVFPGSPCHRNEPESRTPDTLCLSLRAKVVARTCDFLNRRED